MNEKKPKGEVVKGKKRKIRTETKLTDCEMRQLLSNKLHIANKPLETVLRHIIFDPTWTTEIDWNKIGKLMQIHMPELKLDPVGKKLWE